jgi:hypothetical protein
VFTAAIAGNSAQLLEAPDTKPEASAGHPFTKP